MHNHSSARHVSMTRLIIMAMVVMTASGAACDRTPVGPSLSKVTVDGVALAPTAGNAELCCCRVVGTATNLNDVPVHATLKFSGFDGEDPVPLATAVYFLDAMPAHQPQRFEASGFFLSCARIKDLKTEVSVRGLDTVER